MGILTIVSIERMGELGCVGSALHAIIPQKSELGELRHCYSLIVPESSGVVRMDMDTTVSQQDFLKSEGSEIEIGQIPELR